MTRVYGTPIGAAGGVGTTFDVALPSFVAGETLFIAAVARPNATAVYTAPAGWSTIKSDRSSTIIAGAVFYRVMQVGDPSTVSFTVLNTSGTTASHEAIAWKDTDIDPASVIDVVAAVLDNSATGVDTVVLTEIIAGANKRLYAVYFGADNGVGSSGTGVGRTAFTHPAAMTEEIDSDTDVGTDSSIGISVQENVSGATGTRTVVGTPASLTNYRIAAFLFTVNPAPISSGSNFNISAFSIDAELSDIVAIHSLTVESDSFYVAAGSVDQVDFVINAFSVICDALVPDILYAHLSDLTVEAVPFNVTTASVGLVHYNIDSFSIETDVLVPDILLGQVPSLSISPLPFHVAAVTAVEHSFIVEHFSVTTDFQVPEVLRPGQLSLSPAPFIVVTGSVRQVDLVIVPFAVTAESLIPQVSTGVAFSFAITPFVVDFDVSQFWAIGTGSLNSFEFEVTTPDIVLNFVPIDNLLLDIQVWIVNFIADLPVIIGPFSLEFVDVEYPVNLIIDPYSSVITIDDNSKSLVIESQLSQVEFDAMQSNLNIDRASDTIIEITDYHSE